MFYNLHLKKEPISKSVLLIVLTILSCSEPEKEEKYVAKVENSILSENEFNQLNDSFTDFKYREEIINNWVETELLFIEAKENSILESEEYLYLVELNNKKAAISLLLKNYFDNNRINISPAEKIKFYSSNRELFRLKEKSYIYNIALFSDFEEILTFRESLLKRNDWNITVKDYLDDSTNVFSLNVFKPISEINSVLLQGILNELSENEVSIIFNSEQEKYSIVQLVKCYEEFEIPLPEFLDEQLTNFVTLSKRNNLYHDFLNSLYSKYNVEIIRE